MNIKDIVIASENEGKVREIKDIMLPSTIRIRTIKEMGIKMNVKESGMSFEENALIKARFVAQKTGLWALADDSGLMVDALEGKPGIYSARFAGENASDKDNRDKLLKLMENVPWTKRKATFYCCVVLASLDYFISADGRCDGYIAFECMGSGGFGYDPIFFLPQYGKTFAQLDQKIKNTISHRAKALLNLKMKIIEQMR